MPKETAKSPRKRKLKQLLAEGIDCKNAMLQSGYAPATAHNATNQAVVKRCLNELEQKAIMAKVTPEFIISGLVSDLTAEDSKSADRTKIRELLGKHIRLWNEQSISDKGALFSAFMNELPIHGISITPNKTPEPIEDIPHNHNSNDSNGI